MLYQETFEIRRKKILPFKSHLYFIKLWPRSYLCRLHRGQVCMWHQRFHHLVLWPLWSDIHYVDFQLLALPQSLPSVPLWQQWTSPLKKNKTYEKITAFGDIFLLHCTCILFATFQPLNCRLSSFLVTTQTTPCTKFFSQITKFSPHDSWDHNN